MKRENNYNLLIYILHINYVFILCECFLTTDCVDSMGMSVFFFPHSLHRLNWTSYPNPITEK